VADHDHAHARVGDHVVEDREDLQPDGDVERGGRLIGDQICGSGISIMAIMMRWPMPPETSCG
jgi:hypothetical protein